MRRLLRQVVQFFDVRERKTRRSQPNRRVDVTGFYNNTPQFRFVRRKNTVLCVDVEPTTEEDISKALARATVVLESSDLILTGFTCFGDISTVPGHYVFYVELIAKVNNGTNVLQLDNKVLVEYCCVMEESLSGIYRRLRGDEGSIGALEIRVVQKGTFDSLMEFFVSRGSSISQYKTPICIKSTEALQVLEDKYPTQIRFALEKLSVPIFEAAPQPFLLDAGRAPGRRRRVLCSACCSSTLSALSIVISNFNSCVFVVSYAMVSTNRFTVAVSHPLVTSHPLKANRSTGSRISRSAHFLGTVKSPLGVQPEPPLLHHVSSPSQPFEPLVIYSLRQLHPDRSLDVSFQSFVMGLRFSYESYGFQYGNIGVHFLSLISVRVLSWIIVKSIAPPPPPRLVTPFPSEICCYSTASFTRPSHLNADTAYGLSDICFSLGLAHLLVCGGLLLKSTHSWSTKNFPMSDVKKLRHRSSSEASCRSTVCRLVSCRVHLAPRCDVVQGSPSPKFMSIRFKSRQRRPFSMAFSYVSGVTHLFLPPISPYLRQSSIEKSG
ncbi:hypothetical protein F2Q69_00050735 [Brassica cretica]|uniref:GH3 C-terminal domain-containing protein n=1 Tax=Brassica cretica TaxID=69181 RepID=A0A8S9PJF2_BRACR|nr:hypothetical protein F2Q69_00050735 [Brassica cretica]